MLKTFFLLLFVLTLHTKSAAQLKTIEVKKNIWTWTGTQYFMGEQKIRVPEIQLHLDKYHLESGKVFQSGKAPMTWGWVTLWTSSGVLLYDALDQPDNESFDVLFWTSVGLWGASVYLINKGQKRRKKALDTYNGFVLQQGNR